MTEKLRVCIADDDPAHRQIVSRMVMNLGMTVAGTAADGEEAVQMVVRESPDVVIMDLQMPFLDGDEAAALIREQKPTPIVMLSSFQEDHVVARAARAGAAAYLVKPCSPDELGRAIEIAIARFQEVQAARNEVKELRSLYRLLELLSGAEASPGEAVHVLLEALDDPAQSKVVLQLDGSTYQSGAEPHGWRAETRIVSLGERRGSLIVAGPGENASADELRLLDLAASMLSRHIERQEMSERYRATFEQAATGVAHYDLEGRFQQVNQRFCSMLGYTAKELATLRFQRLAQGDELPRPGVGAQIRYLCKDGRELWGLTTVSLVRSSDGEPLYFIAVVEDITPIKRSEQLLAAAEHLAQLGSWSWDLINDRFTISDELYAIFGQRRGTPVTFQTFLSLVHPDDLDRVQATAKSVLEGQAVPRFDYRALRPDGSIRQLTSRTEVDVRDGRAVRAWGFVQDVTERRRLEQEFLQAQKMEAVGRLAGGVAHDFNNLLTTIVGFAEMAREAVGSDTVPVRGFLDEILGASRRANTLTGKLLAFTRKDVPRPTVLDLGTVVGEMEPLLQSLHGERVRLELELPSDPVFVRLDRSQLEQALFNIAANAHEAMPDGGTFKVAFEVHEPTVRLQLTDTGTGMTPEVKARALEPFFSTKPSEEGSGLGLSTAYAIVDRYGGHVLLESEPGQGTRVTLELPLADPPAVEAPVHRPNGVRWTVLVVEDEEPVRRLVTRILEREGLEVLAAPDGPAALELLSDCQATVDLVVTDVVMPGMTGPELVDALSPPRALFVSGYARESVDRLTHDDVEFLSKPFTPVELCERVWKLLSR